MRTPTRTPNATSNMLKRTLTVRDSSREQIAVTRLG
jgi:hypothetical protein